jgi:GMP synthase-like glutamine amidotransferase
MSITTSQVSNNVDKAYDRAWGGVEEDAPWIDTSYPSSPMTQDDLLTAEEAQAQEEKILGKKGIPDIANTVRMRSDAELNDDVPNFLHASAKAGPPLDHLGRTKKERERKIADAIALGERTHQPQLPAIITNDLTTKSRAVTFMRDHELEYPDLYMAVFVVPDPTVSDDEARFARLFSRAGCYKADTIEEADLVVFGGGSDVEPLLYGESNEHAHPTVYFSKERDAADIQVYLQARKQGTPMMGVCRGAQFLHVMNGGKLFQDIDGHQGPHKAFALKDKLMIEKVSSVHHQACIMNKEGGMEVLLTTGTQSSVRWLNADEKYKKPTMDIEGFFYRDTGCFGVQGHPEYADYNKFSVWCLQQVSNLFLCSPDFEWSGKRLQMTQTARDAEQIAAQYIENAYNQSKEA